MTEPTRCRIAITGGPGGGKSTALDLFRRELGDRVVAVPEAATMLFSGGFPRTSAPEARRYAQRAIFEVQRHMEDLHASLHPHRVLLCDRGTVDGAAYWPQDGDFFEAMGTTLEAELSRYDAVLFFESAAVGGMSIEGNNPTRIEDDVEANRIDRALLSLWSQHPRVSVVAHRTSFFAKIEEGFTAMKAVVDAYHTGAE